MHREAAAPSRAVLLATHQPPKIRRVRITEAGRYGTEDVIDQDELLERVRTADDPALIIPVIGAPGTGKSHLVLWLKTQLEQENVPNRRIIYLPKSETRLDRVIDLLLEERTGSPFDEIRQAVASATRAMTTDEAARRLRDELSVAVSKVDVSGGETEFAQMRQHVRDNLPDLLDDPVYARRLVGPGGPLHRIVEQAASGGSDEPAEIKAEDLDVQLTVVEQEELSSPARRLLGDLNGMAALHAVAVDLLNEVRDRCLSRVFGVEPMQLVAVMRELRERLFDENPNLELVLMIEDFTLLQGIQHDLLEAMIELPRREGQQVMCGMKTVMAVTDGFFSQVLASSDTLRTRIAAQGQAYNLDVQYGATGASGLDAETIIDFAGRYLNAVRLGAADLEASAPTVHNACEVCAHRGVCHEAFGTTESEYGLYPFNAVALDRMVRSRQETFNPRDLLAVIGTTLTGHAQELEDGRFPSAGWARNFDPRQFGRPILDTLSPRVEQQVEQAPKPEQRAVLLTFWGGAPSDFRNLPKGVHEAFDVPLASGVKTAAPEVPTVVVEPGPVAPPTDRLAEVVRLWRAGTRLDEEHARVIRRVVYDAILGVLDAEDELMSSQLVNEFFARPTNIVIENSAGQGNAGARRGSFCVELASSSDNALLFEGILKMQQFGSWDVEDGAQTLVDLLTLVDREASRLRAFLEDRISERNQDRSASVALLALSGLVAGKGGVADAQGLLTAAMYASDVEPPEAMPPKWRALIEMAGQRRSVVRDFVLQPAHVSKSTSDPAGVDGRQFSGPLRTFAADWHLPVLSEAAPTHAQRLRQLLDDRLEPALAEAHEVLTAWLEEVGRLVGDADTATTRSKTWRAALDGAEAQGFLVRMNGLTDASAPQRLDETVRVVSGTVERWDDLDVGRRVAHIAKAPWARLKPLRDYLVALEATLGASQEKAETQQGARTEGSPVAAFERALDRIEAATAIEVGS